MTEETNKVGVLLVDSISSQQLGLVTLEPEGWLHYAIILDELPSNALHSIEQFFQRAGIEHSLFEKYNPLMDENLQLPREILEQEAQKYAQVINAEGLSISGYPVRAIPVNYSPKK